MDYEFHDWDKRFEETRIQLFNTANSKLQHHIGYVIAIVVGSSTGSLVTLISQWESVVIAFQSPLSATAHFFYIIISFIASLVFYLIQRTFFWNSYCSSAWNFSSSEIKDLFKKYRSKDENKFLRERLNPSTTIFTFAIAQHFEDLNNTAEKLKLHVKLAIMDGKKTIALSFIAGAIVFDILLWVQVFLRVL